MADDETAPGIPVLSAFDKLKLSSNNNYNNIQRKKNNSNCSNNNSDGNLENSLSINKDSTLVVHSKVPTNSSVISVSSQTSAVSILAATESLKCEKSISLPLAQCEYNNKTLMMFGNCKVSTMFANGDVCENPSASGEFSVFTTPSTPPSTSNQLDNVLISKSITKSEQAVQNRYENERISSTSPPSVSLSQSNQSSSILSSSSSSLSSTSTSTSLSLSLSSSSLTSSLPSLQSLSSSPLASITMVLPNSVNGKKIDVLPSCCPPADQNVDIKSKKIDSNKISVKTVKSGKCKASSSSLTSLSSSSSSLSLPVATTTTSNMQLRPKNLPIVCAPPVMVSVDQKNNKISASSNKVKNQNFCFPMHPGTTNIDAASLKNPTKQNSSNLDNSKKRQSTSNNDRNEQQQQQTTVEDKNNKKKRCSDRYDSSESSDSGVATSLSCTDSSTASSDASDAGSPYSPVLLGDESHHRSNMPPQTILATTNGNAANSPAAGAVTPVQNILKSGKQQQKQQNQSQNKDITSLPQQKQGQVASQLQKVSKHLWSWTSLNNCDEGGHFSEISNSAKTNVTAPNNKSNNKRHSQASITPIDGGHKKTRTTSNHILENGVIGNSGQLPLSSQSNKRLKVAAMEESQTKITGYFKSQMKAQIHQNGLKKDTINSILPSSSKSTSLSATTKAIVSLSSPTSMSSNNVVSTTTTSTGCCLNKYFNLLSSQMRENQERISNPSSNLTSLPVPLKKIERSKPTKIAQVAPNPRKITTASPHSSQIVEKSPKKHVAIAPRTADTRQRHEQSLSSSIKGSATTPQQQQQQQQPAVLLTAIRIPQPNQPPQLVPTSPQQQVTVTNVITSKAQQNVASAAAVAAKIPTGPSLYQIPMMPNLVQFPNLITANVSQLTAARGNTPTSTTQYFLNGTVFKFQQIPTTSTEINLPAFSIENGNESTNMTAATAGTAIKQHASNTKNTSAMTTASFQEMLSNQFQAQQQQAAAQNHRLHSSQPIFMATTTGLLLNAASLPTMLSSNKQTMAIQSQQIPALQPIPGATQMMPGLSSIFSPSQEVSTQQLQQLKSEQVGLDALHHTHIPPLSVPSSAFSKLAIVKTGAAFTQSMRQVSSTQPPPLVTISSVSQNVNISTKASGNGPSISTRPYQKKYAELECKAKTTNQNNNTELAIGAPISFSPKIPSPTLACPPLVAYKEEQRRTEDIFDLLKNSKNETTPTPLSRLSQESKEEDLDTICVQLSSSMLLPETTSNTTLSSESFQLDDSPPSSINNTLVLECSLTSTPSITSESPELTIDIKGKETETAENISETSSPDSTDIALSPTVDTTLAESDILQKSAISPILSQPKTIRFPAKHESNFHFGPKGMRRHDGVCHWDKCDKKHESSSKLLDHMQTHHVNTQIGPFACLWLGCKVYGRESCSRRWLERHVLSHGGTKPFKCIVDGCGLRFGSQLALQKHVNGHFTATENKDSTSKRTSDPPVPKLLRKNGKKLRYRRQPFSARMFDFFDAGIMEGLQHRLRQINTLTNGDNSITFKGEIIMRRKNVKGIVECYVQWAPPKIISNEWLPDSGKPFIKTLSINRMQPNEKTNIESLLRSAYLMPHSPNLFQSFHLLNGQTQQNYTTSYTNSQSNAIKEDTTDGTSLSSSIKNSSLSSISNLLLKSPQIELRQKQSRKPPKRIQPS